MIVMLRPGDRLSEDPDRHGNFENFLKTKISDGYTYSDDRSRFFHQNKQSVCIAHITPLDISSTQIRRLINKKKSIRFLVPDSVALYIETKGLYL